jgi:membrane-associated protease RseP (regulator of RpoE activity)
MKLPFILLKTRRGLNLMDRLSRYRVTKPLSRFYLYLMPVIAAVMIYIALFAIVRYLSTPQLGAFVRGLGPLANLLLPGLNPYLPIVYGWVALWVGLVVHEASHGIMARMQGYTVKDSGLIFFLFVPIGAFVELDEEELKKASPGVAGRILAAGAGSNFLVAVISLALMLLVVSTYAPLSPYHGLGIVSVSPQTPASLAGLTPGDVLLSINGSTLYNTTQLAGFMQGTTPGETVQVSFWHQGRLLSSSVTLVPSPTEPAIGYLGVVPSDDPSSVVTNFLKVSPLSISRYFIFPSIVSSQVPFTSGMQVFYTSPLGAAAPVLANLFFWTWFINFNLALFNALPLGPFDGGVAFRHLLRAITHLDWDANLVRRTSTIVTALMAFIVLTLISLPYLLY